MQRWCVKIKGYKAFLMTCIICILTAFTNYLVEHMMITHLQLCVISALQSVLILITIMICQRNRIERTSDMSDGQSEDINIVLLIEETTTFQQRPMKAIMQKEWMIGSNTRKNDFAFCNDPLISECHCRLIYENGKMYLEDLSSSSGTKCNHQMIQHKIDFISGADIQIGNHSMRIHYILK